MPGITNYLFLGPDAVSKKEALRKALKVHGIQSEGDEPARCLFFASESPADEIFSECITPPFFGGNKAVIVYEAEALQPARVKRYFESPAEGTILFLLSDKNQADYSRTVAALFKKHGEVRMFWDLFENKLETWACQKAAEYGLAALPGIGAFLVERCGRSNRLVERAIQMLANLFEGRAFTLEQAAEAVDAEKEVTVFSFVDAFFLRDSLNALRYGRLLIFEGYDPLFLLAMAYRQLELLWRYRAARRCGKPLSPAILGIVNIAFQALGKMAELWSSAQLAGAGRELFSLECELKSLSRELQIAAFERAVLKICRLC